MHIPGATEKRHRKVGSVVLVLLLLLRIPYTLAIIYLLPIENQSGAAVYEVSAYLLTLFLIWWERDRLSDFHIDGTALVFIVLLRPVQTLILRYWDVDRSPLTFPHTASWMLWLGAVGLSAALWKSGFRLPRLQPWTAGWLLVGMVAGVCVSVLENLRSVRSALESPTAAALPVSVIISSGLNVVYHLSFAPTVEEPMFRGFLWGAIRSLGWREGWILLIQAALFTSAHIYYAARYPLTFWVFIPFAGLLLGMLAWRSRSIAPAMLAHGLINGSVYLLVLPLLTR